MTHAHDILYPPDVAPVMPTGMREVDEWDKLTPEDKTRLQALIRSAYQSAYYRENIEKAKAYQRGYSSEHRRLRGFGSSKRLILKREPVRMTFTIADIMESSVEKTERMIGAILAGTRGLVV